MTQYNEFERYELPTDVVHDFLNGSPKAHHSAERKLMAMLKKGPVEKSLRLLDNADADDLIIKKRPLNYVRIETHQQCVPNMCVEMRVSLLIAILDWAQDVGFHNALWNWDNDSFKQELLESVKEY